MRLATRATISNLVLIAVLTLVIPSLALASDGGDPYPMRERIFRSYEAQTAFRFPYDYRILDQYDGRIARGDGRSGGGMGIAVPPEIMNDPEKLRKFIANAERSGGGGTADVVHTWKLLADLPSSVSRDDPQAILEHLTGKTYERYEAFDYYSDPERRGHGDAEWAREGIISLRALGNQHCAQVLVFEDRAAALALDGSIAVHGNKQILDTFEVMSEVRRKNLMTWREYMTTVKSMVFQHDGQVVKPAASGPVGWDQAWECETASYHITCSASPKTTIQVGALMEALHEAFSSVYKPDVLPPYKMEIHILSDVRAFAQIANAKGFGPVQTGESGSLTGGFFVPSQLSIYTFEQPVPNFPTRMDKVLAHEASHQFLHVTCNGSRHVPTWINEGLAVYFESGEFKNNKFRWMPPASRLQGLRGQYAQNKRTLQPLDQYLNHYGQIAASNYAEVYVMTHFWVFGAKGGKERFHDYWKALKEGEDGSEAFDRIFMQDMIKAQGSRDQAIRTWEEMLVAYMLSGAPGKTR